MSSGSSRECLNLQLIASIPGIDAGIFILISIPPGLLEELSLILGSKLKKRYSPTCEARAGSQGGQGGCRFLAEQWLGSLGEGNLTTCLSSAERVVTKEKGTR